MENNNNNESTAVTIIIGIGTGVKYAFKLIGILFMVLVLYIAYTKYCTPDYTVNIDLSANTVVVKQDWPEKDLVGNIDRWGIFDIDLDLYNEKNNVHFFVDTDDLLSYIRKNHVPLDSFKVETIGTFTNALTDKTRTSFELRSPKDKEHKIVLLMTDEIFESNILKGNDIKLNIKL